MYHKSTNNICSQSFIVSFIQEIALHMQCTAEIVFFQTSGDCGRKRETEIKGRLLKDRERNRFLQLVSLCLFSRKDLIFSDCQASTRLIAKASYMIRHSLILLRAVHWGKVWLSGPQTPGRLKGINFKAMPVHYG